MCKVVYLVLLLLFFFKLIHTSYIPTRNTCHSRKLATTPPHANNTQKPLISRPHHQYWCGPKIGQVTYVIKRDAKRALSRM